MKLPQQITKFLLLVRLEALYLSGRKRPLTLNWIQPLTSERDYNTETATDFFTATADTTADLSSYEIEVNQTTKAQKITTNFASPVVKWWGVP